MSVAGSSAGAPLGGADASGGVAGSLSGGPTAGTASGGSGGGASCAPTGTLLCAPLQPFPASIRELGLFTELPDATRHDARAQAFDPNPPLWSDGLAKQRLIVLPDGMKVDTSDPKRWTFPLGTLLFKSFFDDGGINHAQRPIETRVIRRNQDPQNPFSDWEFAVYRWNADGTDGSLVSFDDPSAATQADVVVDRMENGQALRLNDGQPFSHTIPSKLNCQACHEANAKLTGADVIGFDALRLNSSLPGQSKTQLEALYAAGVFSAPLTTAPTISDPDPVLGRVKSWVFGNCVHCHNGAEPGMLDLQPAGLVQNTVNQDPQGAGIMPPSAEWKRVVPHQPELSVLYVQARRSPLPMGPGVQMRAMPPVGVEIAQPDAVADIATWINGL